MLWLRRLSLKQRLGIMVALVILLLVALTTIILDRHYQAQKEKAHEETMHLVEVVHALLGAFEAQQRAGILTEQQAQTQAIAAVKALRYDTDNYFWIQSDLPAMIMHPLKPALDGQDLSAFKDGNGQRFFKEMAILVQREGSGFVPYVWPLPGAEEPTDKISYVKRFAPWGWTVGTGIYMSRLDASFAHLRNIFIILGLISIALVIAAAYHIGRSIVLPLDEVTERMKDIAEGEGDLTKNLGAEGQDEIARLSRYFNQFVSTMRKSLVEVQDAVEEVSHNANLLAGASQRSNSESESQSSSTYQVASAMEQMATQIHDVSGHATAADKAAVSARQSVSQGTDAVQKTVSQIDSLTGSIESVSTVVSQLAQQTEQIGLVLDVIRSIAEQTNLLALNAAIEAARAGEQGRGFAVVADEVRTLASRTGQSTDEIRAMIQQLQAGAKAAVSAVQISQSAATSTVDNATEANTTLQTLDRLIADISSMNSQIARATEQQADAANEVNLRITELSGSAEHNLTTAAELAKASNALEQSATVMRQIVQRFKV